MLHDINERPVNTLEDPARLDVVRAIDSLETASRMTQSTGWWFNTEFVTIALDSENHYVLPEELVHAEVLSGGPVATADQNPVRLVQRGTRLYDRANAVDEFVSTSEPVILKCVRLIDFADLPANVREYIYCVASIRFQSRTLGSTSVDADLRDQARVALTNMQEEDIDFEDLDQTLTPHFFNLMHNR
jgi:hypothetical protein